MSLLSAAKKPQLIINNKIDFSEFLSIMTSDPISDHEMKGIFNEFDLNRDGEITFQGRVESKGNL